jgi:hypothetical protein
MEGEGHRSGAQSRVASVASARHFDDEQDQADEMTMPKASTTALVIANVVMITSILDIPVNPVIT